MEHFIWDVDPILFSAGPIQLHWYGLFFVGSFYLALLFLQWVYKREGREPSVLDNLLIYLLAGTVIGARLMHCFAYEPEFYLSHPLEIFKVWKGGLASHGGLLGVFAALYFFSKKYKESYLWLISRVAIPGAFVAGMIRVGNLFNSEILGLPSEKPWAIIFSRIDMIPRHPVQLYEALAYFLLFFILLQLYKKISFDFSSKIIPGIFLSYVFLARFLLEYTKTPQADYSTSLPFSTGQLLSIPFIILGLFWIVWALKTKSSSSKKSV